MLPGFDSDGFGGSVEQLLLRALIDGAVDDMSRPHIVICESRDGSQTFRGPFDDGLAALAAAEEDYRSEEEAGTPTLTFRVAPLYPV